MTEDLDILDILHPAYEAVDKLSDARVQAMMQTRRDIGVAAAMHFVNAFFNASEKGELPAWEYVAVHLCGIGQPFSAVGEEDLTSTQRLMEFLELPELEWVKEAPPAAEFLRQQRES